MAKTAAVVVARGRWEATLRNVRAMEKKIDRLTARVARIERRLAK